MKPLSDLIQILTNMDDPDFTRCWKSNASIGAHVRHIIEYIDNFISGCDCGNIDYDNRPRDLTFSESRDCAIKKLKVQYDELCSIPLNERQICIKESIDADVDACSINSNVIREYTFVHSHIVHHVAILKILAENCGISISNDVGMAPATIKAIQR